MLRRLGRGKSRGEGLTESAHYKNAPIIEATLSLGVLLPQVSDAKKLFSIYETLKDRYPIATEEHFYSGSVRVGEPGEPPEHDDVHGHIGYVFSDEHERCSLRVTMDSFEFSVGQPYDRWQSFRDEALNLWAIFKNAFGVTEISRVGLRYINRIDIPNTGLAKIEDYFNVYLEIPVDWPGGTSLTNYFFQFQAPQPDLGCELVVNQAPAPSPESNMVSFRLDFDLFKELYHDPWLVSKEEEVWQFLEQLRERKNAVFNASITEATRELIRG
jgi:uncharacterized protein (TIGR04255 family)